MNLIYLKLLTYNFKTVNVFRGKISIVLKLRKNTFQENMIFSVPFAFIMFSR